MKLALAFAILIATIGGCAIVPYDRGYRSDGYYRGATYVGALQLLEAGPGKLNGRWIGFGKDSEINDGPWSLELTDSRLSPEAVSRWDLAVS